MPSPSGTIRAVAWHWVDVMNESLATNIKHPLDGPQICVDPPWFLGGVEYLEEGIIHRSCSTLDGVPIMSAHSRVF